MTARLSRRGVLGALAAAVAAPLLAEEAVAAPDGGLLRSHDGLDPEPLHVGAAAVFDLREGHYGRGDIRYAVDSSGDPLPAGLALDGDRLVGVPVRVGAARTVLRLERLRTGEVALMPLTLSVNPPDPGVFAAARPLPPPPGGRLQALVGGGWALRFPARADAANDARLAAFAFPTVPGATYRMTATLRPDAALDGPATVRIAHEDVDLGAKSSFDDWDGFIGEADHDGAATPRQLAIVFVAGRTEAILQFGAVWRGPHDWVRTDLAGRTLILSDVRIAAAPDLVPPGGATVAQRFRRFGVTVVLDRPRRVGRYVNGEYWILNDAPGTDPLRIVALGPADGGAHLNWGATAVPQGEPAQGFDPRAGRKGALNQLRYDAAINVDPGRRGAPLVWSAAGAGVEGSVDKAVLQPYRRYFKGGKQSLLEQVPLTVVTADPGPDAFMPPTSVVAKAHKRLSDLVPGWLDLAPKLPRPAGLAAYDATKLRYFMLRPYQIGTQNQPRDRNVNARYNGREYGREQSRRWEEVMMALLTDPDQGGVSAADREWLALQSIQNGIALDGRDQAGGVWISNGGGSQNRKPFAVFAALAFDDAGMRARVDARLRQGYADDRFIAPVSRADIETPLIDYDPRSDARPRAAYAPEMLGMPEWRNNPGRRRGKTGANYLGDGYRGISMTPALGGFLFAGLLRGGREAWGAPTTFDYADRHFQWALNGVVRGETKMAPGVEAMWRAFRAGGAPVAMRRWGLVETGVAPDLGPADPASGATDIPTMRRWRPGVTGVLDLAAEEFNARARLADGAPERYALAGAFDALGAPIPVPDWIALSPEGLLAARPPDEALRFFDVIGSNRRGAATARVAIAARKPQGPLLDAGVEISERAATAALTLDLPFSAGAGEVVIVDLLTEAGVLRDASVGGVALGLLRANPPLAGRPRLWRLAAAAPSQGWIRPRLALRFATPTGVRAVGWGLFAAGLRPGASVVVSDRVSARRIGADAPPGGLVWAFAAALDPAARGGLTWGEGMAPAASTAAAWGAASLASGARSDLGGRVAAVAGRAGRDRMLMATGLSP